jgi:LPS export ABC transporter permease LptG
LTKDLLGFADLVINRGFGVWAVARIAFYEIVPLAARTLPFAVLVGALVGLGRLRADREILSLEAAGISSQLLVEPVLAFAAVTTVAGLFLSLYAAPWASWSLDAALRQMVQEHPGLSLRSGTVHEFGDVKMLAREVSARGDQVRGVLLWIPNLGQTIFAERGELKPGNNGVMELMLYDGMMLPSPQEKGEGTHFATYWQTLQENFVPLQRKEDALAGESLPRVAALAWGGTEDSRLALQARIELHRRFSYPAACAIFGLLSVPLALSGHGFSRAAGGVVGLLVTVVYYGFMQLGEGLIQAGVVNAGMGVWLPNLIIGTLAVLLLWRASWRWMWRWKTSRQQRSETESRQTGSRVSHIRRFILQRYAARSYLQMLLLSFGILFSGYLLIDVLERLQWFARHHATTLEILRFYGARSPLLVSRVVPMSLLLATALTVSIFSVQREIIGMRACGVFVPRALSPILLIAGILMPAYFVLNEVVVPQTNMWADRLKEAEIKDRKAGAKPLQMMVWYQDSTHLYQATQLDPALGEAQELSIYELGENGLPVSRTDARAARHIGNGIWELVDPVRVGISEHGLQELRAEARVQLGEAPTTTVDTMHLGVRQLAEAIHGAEASGYSTTPYRVDFHMKLAAPLTCVLLPAVALFFAIGGPPFPGPAVTILVSSGLGVGYILLTGVCASLGYGGGFPPSLAGWGPAVGLGALAVALARRSLR